MRRWFQGPFGSALAIAAFFVSTQAGASQSPTETEDEEVSAEYKAWIAAVGQLQPTACLRVAVQADVHEAINGVKGLALPSDSYVRPLGFAGKWARISFDGGAPTKDCSKLGPLPQRGWIELAQLSEPRILAQGLPRLGEDAPSFAVGPKAGVTYQRRRLFRPDPLGFGRERPPKILVAYMAIAEFPLLVFYAGWHNDMYGDAGRVVFFGQEAKSLDVPLLEANRQEDEFEGFNGQCAVVKEGAVCMSKMRTELCFEGGAWQRHSAIPALSGKLSEAVTFRSRPKGTAASFVAPAGTPFRVTGYDPTLRVLSVTLELVAGNAVIGHLRADRDETGDPLNRLLMQFLAPEEYSRLGCGAG